MKHTVRTNLPWEVGVTMWQQIPRKPSWEISLCLRSEGHRPDYKPLNIEKSIDTTAQILADKKKSDLRPSHLCIYTRGMTFYLSLHWLITALYYRRTYDCAVARNVEHVEILQTLHFTVIPLISCAAKKYPQVIQIQILFSEKRHDFFRQIWFEDL